MATINLGNLTFTHKGDYAGGTAYVKNDVVYYATNGNSYIAKGATTGNAPTSTAHWDLFVAGSSGIWNAGLSLGSASQKLRVNSGGNALEFFTEPAVTSDFVKIKTITQTLSDGSSVVDFVHGTGGVVFDGTYNTYKFIMSRYTPQNAVDVNAQVIISGTAQTSGYVSETFRSYYSGGSDRSNSTSFIGRASYGMQGGSVVNQSVGLSEFTTTNPSISQYPQVHAQHSGAEANQIITSHSSGKWQTTTTNWNGMRFKTADGSNMEATIVMYGLKA